MKAGDKPVIDGYYAFRKGESAYHEAIQGRRTADASVRVE